MLPQIKYNYKKGPLAEGALNRVNKEGNCHLAIQFYFYKVHNLYLAPEQILCPQSFRKTGEFIWRENGEGRDFTDKVKSGDIIYAQGIKNKNGKYLQKNKNDFKDESDWLTSLHTAIFLGDNKIWHASAIAEVSGCWGMEKFLDYYRPIAVKRVLFEQNNY